MQQVGKLAALQTGDRARGGDKISPTVVMGLLRVGDVLAICLAGAVAYYVRHAELDVPGNYAITVLIAAVALLNVFKSLRLYKFSSLTSTLFQARRIFLGWMIVGSLILTLGFLTKMSSDFSRTWFILWFILGLAGLSLLRFGVKLMVLRWQHQGRLTRRIAIVGAGPSGQRIINHWSSYQDPNLELVGVFDDRRSRVPAQLAGCPVLGSIGDLMLLVREHKVDEVIVALPWTAESRLIEIIGKLRTAPVDIKLSPEGIAFQFANHGFSDVRGVQMLNIAQRPLSHWDHVVKNIEDRLLALVILTFIAPLLVTIAILIKLEGPGPVFFRQSRYGFNNKVIEVFKFRTMRPETENERTVHQATRNDPRVTRIGAFLRRSSLDELPQFFNVLRGEMSIVGPRPHAIAHNEEFATILDQYLARHNVKPGITGWAQVNGFRGEIRNKQDLENRIRYDLYYIDNWSLLFDLRIIVMTLFRGFVHENAY